MAAQNRESGVGKVQTSRALGSDQPLKATGEREVLDVVYLELLCAVDTKPAGHELYCVLALGHYMYLA